MPHRAQRSTAGYPGSLARLALWSCLTLTLTPLPALPGTATLPVSRFDITGNQALTTPDLAELLRPATGPAIDLGQLRDAVQRVQDLYRSHGFPDATVRIPRQVVPADGTVRVEVHEGTPALVGTAPAAATTAAPANASAASPTPTPAPPEPVFEVRKYEVTGNTVLSGDVVDKAFAEAVGERVDFSRIQRALGTLQLAYRDRGYATVAVSLPPQQLTNATVKVSVTEGVLADIRVVGNRHFSSNNVVGALPSLRTNTLLNGRVFQRELDVANQNRDRQIFPTLGPGPEPGTSALTLRVRDRLPLHGRVELNNQSTPGTPEWRINSSLQYNNLWQREHQAGVSYGFSPEAYKGGGHQDDYLLNRPLIANLGGYYRLPIGDPESVAEQLQGSAAFGYDEATRQFRLPPAGVRPDLSFFASASSSDTGIQRGAARVVSQTPLLTIVSQDTGQNLSQNLGAGGRFSLPLPWTDTRRLVLSAGVDWKSYALDSFNTNNFVITTVVTNSQGSQTIESRVASPQPARHHEVQYLPLVAGADYFGTDAHGSLAASLSAAVNFVGSSADFAALAYSPEAEATYARFTSSLTREHRLPGDWSVQVRAAGQAATGALISNEQFALGGVASVRGYYEGDEYGDAGWSTSVEARTPYLHGRVPTWSDYSPVWLRGLVFVDGGQRLLLEDTAAGHLVRSLVGTGFGLSANINNTVDFRLVIGWPILSTPNSKAGDPHAYLSLGGQF